MHSTTGEFQAVPFDKSVEFTPEWSATLEKWHGPLTVPGHPRISMAKGEKLLQFLERELWSPEMDTMSSVLWMMSSQSHANISALHRQILKGRQIVITEDPKLHLVWFHNRVFIKPLPKYLCSYNFWKLHLTAGSPTDYRVAKLRAAALGYLRTWFYLIRHESDFRIAQLPELQLIPTAISWDQFCQLSASFEQIEDSQVWARYHYGEVRLTRLNIYGKLFLRRWSFQRMYGNYGDYFARFYGPLLFIFAVISVLLNSMQVVMSVEQVSSAGWTAFWAVSRWSGVLCAVMIVVVSFALFLLFLYKFCAEWRRALTDRWQRKQRDLELQVQPLPLTTAAKP